MAAELGLRTAPKPDSQDVCFITKSDGREAFLAARTELHQARVVDSDGVVVGAVDAIEMVTIGQRRGLNLAGGSEPRFVTDVDVSTSTVTIGTRRDLMTDVLVLDQIVWAAEAVTGQVMVQCSAHGTAEAALITDAAGPSDGSVTLRWMEPHRRVAPGQSVVMYQLVGGRELGEPPAATEVVVGGGIAR